MSAWHTIRRTLINVVTQVHGKIQILLRQAAERRIIAVPVVLARDKRKPQAIEGSAIPWGRARAAHGAQLVADLELIPIPVRRLELLDLHVDGMAEFWHC